jgi:hypothetical protein
MNLVVNAQDSMPTAVLFPKMSTIPTIPKTAMHDVQVEVMITFGFMDFHPQWNIFSNLFSPPRIGGKGTGLGLIDRLRHRKSTRRQHKGQFRTRESSSFKILLRL